MQETRSDPDGDQSALPYNPRDLGLISGTRLGVYEIVAPLGAGGMGEVYRARDPRLERQVAIKLLPAGMAADSEARERLRREALAVAALDHPYICKIFEIGADGDELFLVMEYIAGTTLHDRLLEGPMPLPEAIRVAGEIAEALLEAHAVGFLHRDLKPANIMLTQQGHVKVMDFGLAKRVEDLVSPDTATRAIGEPQLTAQGVIVGTPDYMSPEQLKGQPLDARSDLFSFGVMLAEMTGGRHPFRKQSTIETCSAVLSGPPSLSGDIPLGVRLLLERLVAKEAGGSPPLHRGCARRAGGAGDNVRCSPPDNPCTRLHAEEMAGAGRSRRRHRRDRLPGRAFNGLAPGLQLAGGGDRAWCDSIDCGASARQLLG